MTNAAGPRNRRSLTECQNLAKNPQTACHTADRSKEKTPPERGFMRADARTRTGDPFITSEVLYQLSYVGVCRDFPDLPRSRSGFGLRRCKILVDRCFGQA
jgi:hypothetical protein